MNCPATITSFGWYGAGWSVFRCETDDQDYYPPLDDLKAQREWLDGFHAAWVEYPDEEGILSILYGDGTGGETIESALSRVLENRQTLLLQLLRHGHGNRTEH